MAYKKKTWQEKLEDCKSFPKIIKFDPKFPCGRALEKMGAKPGDNVVLVPQVKYCCTLTTGIFVMTAANAAEETKSDVPYWRTIKNNGELNEKYPDGAERQKKLLEKEGHTVIKKGKKYYVKDFEEKLI